jgi:hypothetical protein
MDSLKFPITFNNDGSLTKLAEGSDEYFKQLVSFCLLTEPNSLRLTPDFGVFDITFNKLAPEALAISVNKFIPEIQIKNIKGSLAEDDGTLTVSFVYNRKG